jgi:hypothetical protein
MTRLGLVLVLIVLGAKLGFAQNNYMTPMTNLFIEQSRQNLLLFNNVQYEHGQFYAGPKYATGRIGVATQRLNDRDSICSLERDHCVAEIGGPIWEDSRG